jgi:trehalose/maltose hydrolase-like predicted phosphorylase
LWQAVVFGFAGLKLGPEGWQTLPHLPAHWKRLAFKVQFKGKTVDIDLKNSSGGMA